MNRKEKLQKELDSLDASINVLDKRRCQIRKALIKIRLKENQRQLNELATMIKENKAPYFYKRNENKDVQKIAKILNIENNTVYYVEETFYNNDDETKLLIEKSKEHINCFKHDYLFVNALNESEYKKFKQEVYSGVMLNFYREDLFEKVTKREYVDAN